MTAFLLASVYGGVAGVLYAGLIRLRRAGDVQHRQHVPAARDGDHRRAAEPGRLCGRRDRAVPASARCSSTTRRTRRWRTAAVVVLTVVFAPTGLAGLPAPDPGSGRPAGLAPARQAVGRGDDGVPAVRPRRRPRARRRVDPARCDERQHALPRAQGAAATSRSTVAAGEIRGIVGPNGSGKTTLFNVVSGLYRPTAGRVFLDGRDVTAARPYALARAGIARTFQNLRLFRDADGAGQRPRRARPDPGPQHAGGTLLLAGRRLAARPGAARRRPTTCSTGSGSPRSPTTCRPRCRTASSAGSRSPARWPAGPRAAAARRAGRRSQRRGGPAARRHRPVDPRQRGHRRHHRAQHGPGHVAVRAGHRAGQRRDHRRRHRRPRWPSHRQVVEAYLGDSMADAGPGSVRRCRDDRDRRRGDDTGPSWSSTA